MADPVLEHFCASTGPSPTSLRWPSCEFSHLISTLANRTQEPYWPAFCRTIVYTLSRDSITRFFTSIYFAQKILPGPNINIEQTETMSWNFSFSSNLEHHAATPLVLATQLHSSCYTVRKVSKFSTISLYLTEHVTLVIASLVTCREIHPNLSSSVQCVQHTGIYHC